MTKIYHVNFETKELVKTESILNNDDLAEMARKIVEAEKQEFNSWLNNN
jgi:hypothetical protein